jgi:hypothetical protein
MYSFLSVVLPQMYAVTTLLADAGGRAVQGRTWLLGLRVRIPLGAWVFVCCVYILCCLLSVEAFTTSRSVIQRSPTLCLIRFRNPKGASVNVDIRSNPRKLHTLTHTEPLTTLSIKLTFQSIVKLLGDV